MSGAHSRASDESARGRAGRPVTGTSTTDAWQPVHQVGKIGQWHDFLFKYTEKPDRTLQAPRYVWEQDHLHR